ncbi:MAG: hypothetical protein K2Y32_22050 [Candidatus Obscuribacterales bacterium]|nr:hypothetical protein [Candidatus Obscuribacterales bacterium]
MKWSHDLDDRQILGVMSDEGRGLLRGCYWGKETRHGVLDVDAGSKYHTPEGLKEITADFAAVGIALVPYRSSESGGWHLYFYFDKAVLSNEVETTIKDYLRHRRYEIKSGTLEVFPSGNALRLPLQKGFAWLTPDGRVKTRREEISQGEAIASFLRDLEGSRSNWEEVKTLIGLEIYAAGVAGAGEDQEDEEGLNEEGFSGLFRPGLDWEKYQRGKQYWQIGLTGPKQRHDAIVCLGHYLWYGDEAAGVNAMPGHRNIERRKQLIRECLKEKHNGHSEDINAGRWSEVDADIERAASWSRQTPLVQEYEPYQLTVRLLKRLRWLHTKTGKRFTIEELAKANIDRSLDARQRIAMAVAQLEAEGSEIDISKVATRAKASRNTVRKNRDLLGSWSGEYVAGGLGGLSLLLDCLASLESVPSSSLGSANEVSVLDPVPSELGLFDLVVSGSQDFPVDPPLLHAWQDSLPENPQSQAQALRVPTASLTLGPWLSGIQALRPETAGGLSLLPGVGLLGGFDVEPIEEGVQLAAGDDSFGFSHLFSGPSRHRQGKSCATRSRVVGRGPP